MTGSLGWELRVGPWLAAAGMEVGTSDLQLPRILYGQTRESSESQMNLFPAKP